jgi:hypothetical protein
MMERYKGYWISGSAVPGPPNSRHWKSLGTIPKDGGKNSVVEVGRIQDTGITFDLAGMAATHGMELERKVDPSFSLQRLNACASFALVLCEILEAMGKSGNLMKKTIRSRTH